MKLVVLDAATLGQISLDPLLDGFEASVYPMTHPDETLARVSDASIVVTNKVVLDRDILAAADKLELICVAATGTNNIDLAAARDLKIPVSNVPGYSTASVVSHTFAMYFHLAHGNTYHDRYTREGGWCRSDIFTHLDVPFGELDQKVWGIIGLGAIGRGVAQIAHAFGCRVVYHSTSGANMDQPWLQLPLEVLLTKADVVSIHAPLSSKTRGLIGGKQLAIMKKTAFLINTSRGGIVREDELAKALNEGQIAGGALDVLEKEPPDSSNSLFHLTHPERLFVTPHIAGLSTESRRRLVAELRGNIDAFRQGNLRNLVRALPTEAPMPRRA